MKKYLFSNEKKFQPDLTSFDPSKKLSAKIASTISQNVAKMLKKICLNLPNSAKMLKKICLKNKIIRNKIWSIKVVKKYLFSNEKKISARSDVIWPFKKIICQNRIKTVSEIYILLKVFNRNFFFWIYHYLYTENIITITVILWWGNMRCTYSIQERENLLFLNPS